MQIPNLEDGPQPGQWCVLTLGPPEASLGRRILRLRSKRTWGVLLSLLRSPDPVSRETLIHRFWMETEEARVGLRMCLTSLRQELGSESIECDGPWVSLTKREDFWLDVTALTELDSALGDCAEDSVTELSETMRLYRGPFLQGLDVHGVLDPWLADQRLSIQELSARMFIRLARGYAEEGRYRRASEYANQAFRLFPERDSLAQLVLEYGKQSGEGATSRARVRRARLGDFVDYLHPRGAHPPELTSQEETELRRALDATIEGLPHSRVVGLSRLAWLPGPVSGPVAASISKLNERELRQLAEQHLLDSSTSRPAQNRTGHVRPGPQRTGPARTGQDQAGESIYEVPAVVRPIIAEKFAPTQETIRSLVAILSEVVLGGKSLSDPVMTHLIKHWVELGPYGLANPKPFCALMQHVLTSGGIVRQAIHELLQAWVDGSILEPEDHLEALIHVVGYLNETMQFGAGVGYARQYQAMANDPLYVAHADHFVARFYHHSAQRAESVVALEVALQSAKAWGEEPHLRMVHHLATEIYQVTGQLELASVHAEMALKLACRTGSDSMRDECLYLAANIFFALGEKTKAELYWKESLERRYLSGDLHGQADCLRGLASVALSHGESLLAESHLRHAIVLYDSIGKSQSRAAAMGDLGDVLNARGDAGRAKALYLEGLAVWKAANHAAWIENFEARLLALEAED